MMINTNAASIPPSIAHLYLCLVDELCLFWLFPLYREFMSRGRLPKKRTACLQGKILAVLVLIIMEVAAFL